MTVPAASLVTLAGPQLPSLEREIRRTLQKEPPVAALDGLPLADGVLEQEIARAVEEILSPPLEDVLVAGWRKWSELRQHAEATRVQPGVTHVVPLVAHDLVSAHKPTIRVLLNDATLVTLAFDLSLKFHLEGFRATLQAGAIQSVTTGAARLSVVLAYKGQEIWNHRFDEVSLPAEWRFDPAVEV